MSGLEAMFCNCCHDGCDCGCAETCGLIRHRHAPASDQHSEGR